MLSAIMLNVIMLNVANNPFKLSFGMLSVVAPLKRLIIRERKDLIQRVPREDQKMYNIF
jgi:hypothetical protein